MGHIFISYSHKDKDYVDKLEKVLQKEGFEVWIDDRIHYGSDWPKVVTTNLDNSDGVIVILSNNSYQSDMVQNEVVRAREKNKPIFPILLDEDTWLIIQTKQFVDVRDGSLPDRRFYDRLAGFTSRKITTSLSSGEASAPQSRLQKSKPEKSEQERLASEEQDKGSQLRAKVVLPVRAITSRQIVRDWMSSSVTVVHPDSIVTYALTLMRRRRIHCVVVDLSEKNPSYCILTTRDIRDKVVALGRNPAETTVREIMSGPVDVAKPAWTLIKCSESMQKNRVGYMPVADHSGKIIGVISETDIFVAVEESGW